LNANRSIDTKNSFSNTITFTDFASAAAAAYAAANPFIDPTDLDSVNSAGSNTDPDADPDTHPIPVDTDQLSCLHFTKWKRQDFYKHIECHTEICTERANAVDYAVRSTTVYEMLRRRVRVLYMPKRHGCPLRRGRNRPVVVDVVDCTARRVGATRVVRCRLADLRRRPDRRARHDMLRKRDPLPMLSPDPRD
jgi:hypothetical protein